MRKECNYRLLVARKCLESIFALLYFFAIVNAQLCRILFPHVVSHLHETTLLEGKTVLRGTPSPPLCIFLYIYILLSFLPLFFLFFFFFTRRLDIFFLLL